VTKLLTTEISVSDRYRRPLWSAALTSIALVFLSALMLDFGQTCRLSAIALGVFWGWVFIGMVRRPRNPTLMDLVLIERGCVPFVVGVQALIHLAWHWRGY
jgi:hypothetical protein